MSPISLSDISVNFSNTPSAMVKPSLDFMKHSDSAVIKVLTARFVPIMTPGHYNKTPWDGCTFVI